MNKGELIAGMAEESGVSKADAEKVLNAFLSQVEKALCAEIRSSSPASAALKVKERAERTGRNPKTNEPIVIPAGKMPVFKAGKVLKDAIK